MVSNVGGKPMLSVRTAVEEFKTEEVNPKEIAQVLEFEPALPEPEWDEIPVEAYSDE